MKSVDGKDDDDDDDMDEEASWAKLGGEIIRGTIEQNEYGLGLSLAGTNNIVAKTEVLGKHITIGKKKSQKYYQYLISKY